MSATGESGLGHKVEETKQYAQEKAGQTQEAAKVALIMQISYAIWLGSCAFMVQVQRYWTSMS